MFSLESLLEANSGQSNSKLEIDSNRPKNPDEEAQNRDLRDILNRALQAIPEEQRVVIVMKEYQGLKFTEIAEALQTSVNTVKSRMYYGLSAIRKVFKQWNIDEEMIEYEV